MDKLSFITKISTKKPEHFKNLLYFNRILQNLKKPFTGENVHLLNENTFDNRLFFRIHFIICSIG